MMICYEMADLMRRLSKMNIPYEIDYSVVPDFVQLWYPNKENAVCDVIWHPYSFGFEDGLLEIMGLTEDEEDTVEGYLTGEQVARRIASDWIAEKVMQKIEKELKK